MKVCEEDRKNKTLEVLVIYNLGSDKIKNIK